MYSLRIIKLIIIVTFFILIGAIYFISSNDMQNRKNVILNQQINNLENTYEVSMNRFKIISNIINTTLINRKDILELLYKANNTNDLKSLAYIRGELFQKIKPYFDDLKEVGVIITLFAFENNKTFLRVHKPNKFNDDLSKVRYSFNYVNKNKKIIRGLEEGKIMHAFRNVYPIHYKGKYLGSVDIAFSSEVLRKHMESLHNTHTHFIINKSVFTINVWKMKDMANYISSLEHIDFLYNVHDTQRDNPFTEIEISLNYKLKKEIYKNIATNNSFALEDNGQIVSFLAIKNIKDKKTIAYLVSYKDSQYMKDVIKEYIYINIFSFITLLMLSIVIYINIQKRFLLTTDLEKEVKDQNKAFEAIFEKASDGVIIFENEYIVQCNEAIVKMFGLKKKEDIINKHLVDISPKIQPNGSMSIEETRTIFNHVIEKGVNIFEWKYKKLNGNEFWAAVTLTSIILADKTIVHALLKDITIQKDIEEEFKNEKILLDYKANHDWLTLLPNRTLFNDRLIQSIKTSNRYNHMFAILFLDLDKFKPINDSLGHLVGDKVLQEVAKRLKSLIREEDTVARLGGDEFTIIMQNLKTQNDVSVLAKKIIDSLEMQIDVDTYELYISASVGISIYPHDSTNAETLLAYADVAMYKAKDEGRNCFEFYTP